MKTILFESSHSRNDDSILNGIKVEEPIIINVIFKIQFHYTR